MKKILSLFAIAAMVAVACSKDDKDDNDNKKPDPKPVEEYTGPVEGTSAWSVVGTLLESNWGSGAHADYVCAESNGAFVLKNVKLVKNDQIKFRKDKLWDVNRGINEPDVAAELVAGTPTKALPNGGNIIIPADGIFDLYYFEAKEAIVYVQKDAALPEIPDFSEPAQPVAAAITIDGDFADWAALKDGTYSKTFGDEDAPKPALTKAFVYADPNFIYVYFEWDKDMISYEAGVEHVPFHCYINTDGDASTSGYADQFADACSDVLLEGFIYPDGVLGSYYPGAYKWIGEPNASGWGWAPDTDNLFPEGGLGEGAGVEGKYEFKLDRAMFANVGLPIADVFSIGFDIQQNWDSVGILPSVAPDESNPSGVVNSLQVTTQK
jgi:hypothetical protein